METKQTLQEIPIEKVLANFYQPRTKFDKEKGKELAESILSNGLINPITVRTWKGGRYMIVAGERRWRAHKIAKLKTITAFVKDYKSQGQFMVESLIENLHREDLTDWEEWKFIKQISKEEGWMKEKQVDLKIVHARLHINEMRLIMLRETFERTSQIVREAVRKGKIDIGTATEISRLKPKVQEELAKQSLKSEDGLRRSEVRERAREERPEPLRLERTANDVVDDVLSNLHDFKYHADELLKKKEINIEDLSKPKADKAITTAGLHLKVFKDFINALRLRGAKPDKNILALIRVNGKI